MFGLQKKFYAIGTSSDVSDYLNVGNSLATIERYCSKSEFQYLDKKVLTVELDSSSGTECQDFIYKNGVPLISERLKDFFDKRKIDYLFYKKIILKKSDIGLEEIYWLALPQRIECLNREKSDIDDMLNLADEIVINENQIGRFEIFKLAGVTNLEIIVTESLAEDLKAEKFVGMHIYKI